MKLSYFPILSLFLAIFALKAETVIITTPEQLKQPEPTIIVRGAKLPQSTENQPKVIFSAPAEYVATKAVDTVLLHVLNNQLEYMHRSRLNPAITQCILRPVMLEIVKAEALKEDNYAKMETAAQNAAQKTLEAILYRRMQDSPEIAKASDRFTSVLYGTEHNGERRLFNQIIADYENGICGTQKYKNIYRKDENGMTKDNWVMQSEAQQ